MSEAADVAFASFEAKWLAAHPEQRYAALFLPPAQRLRASAFGCLVAELEDAVAIREPDVAAAKLGWWAQELEGAAMGHARHPVTVALFDDTARGIDRTLWSALAIAAMKQVVNEAPAADMEALLAQAEPLSLAIADAEAALFLAPPVNVDANAALWALTALLDALAGLASAGLRLPVPLGLLARHGLARDALAEPNAARDALVKDQLAALAFELRGAQGVATPRTLALRLRVQAAVRRIGRAQRAGDALAALAVPQGGALRNLFVTWREARAMLRGR